MFKNAGYMFNGKSISIVEVVYYSDEKEEMSAVRKPIDTSFSASVITKVTDTGIQKGGKPELAFTPEGIENMNQHIADYNGGNDHKPIRKVRLCEPMGNKFAVGENGSKSMKFAEAQSGTNLYFAIYKTAEDKRSYRTVPMNEVINRLKQGMGPVPDTDTEGNTLLFSISPNDLVYVPDDDEQISAVNVEDIKKERIYKFVDSSGTTANFVPYSTSSLLYNVKKDDAADFCKGNIVQNEYGMGSLQSKNQKSLQGKIIKDVCLKLTVNRLGQVYNIIR